MVALRRVNPAIPAAGRAFRPRSGRRFRAKAGEALAVLTRCLQSDDERIAMLAAQAILDRGYGKPHQTQSIDTNINDDPVRYVVLPEKAATTEEWLESIRREDAERALVAGVAAAVDDERTH